MSAKGPTMKNFIDCSVRLIKSVSLNLKKLRCTGHVTRIEEGRSAFKVLTCKPTGKRFRGSIIGGWEDNIRMTLKEICINTRKWVDSAQDSGYWRALANAALNLRVP